MNDDVTAFVDHVEAAHAEGLGSWLCLGSTQARGSEGTRQGDGSRGETRAESALGALEGVDTSGQLGR